MESNDPHDEANLGEVTPELALKQSIYAMAKLLLPQSEQQKPEVAEMFAELEKQLPVSAKPLHEIRSIQTNHLAVKKSHVED
jgi:hypothetical protein